MAEYNPARLSENAQKSLVKYVGMALEEHRKREDLINKMTVIDIAYARYKESLTDSDGVDTAAANMECGVNLDDITAPIVVAQVDSFVGYLADVFLSGYPIFPVVSTPKYRKEASQLQSIIDSHAMLGGYPRQLLKFLRDCIKYNLGAVEVDWVPVDKYSMNLSTLNPTDPAQAKKATEYYSCIKWRDPYNLIGDPRVVDMADIPYKGEYVGYVELVSRVELVKLLQYLETTVYGYNTTQALHTAIGSVSSTALSATSGMYYRERPQISDIVTARSFRQFMDFDWDRWLNSQPQRQGRQVKGMYEVATLYARIIPTEHQMHGPNSKMPQVWKLKVVNNDKLICAQRIISAYDILPILIGQPMEDGFGEQTQSIGEMQIPMQEAASTLINIRFATARRAVADRAVYDPRAIDSSDINAPIPAPKIPLKPNALTGGKTIDSIYKTIPFDPRGTDGVIQDAREVYMMSGQLTGLNKPQQGEFQKGNKSVKEWNDTMAGSDNRLRLPALCLEYQVFVPLKEQLKLNIYQYGPTGIFMNYKQGDVIEISQDDINKLRQTVLFFKLADGYIPAAKLASTDAIVTGMQMIQQSPFLQQVLGPALPGIWAHLMTLGGVQGLDEYIPQAPAGPAQGTTPTTPNTPQGAPNGGNPQGT